MVNFHSTPGFHCSVPGVKKCTDATFTPLRATPAMTTEPTGWEYTIRSIYLEEAAESRGRVEKPTRRVPRAADARAFSGKVESFSVRKCDNAKMRERFLFPANVKPL
jgi:hypothetical protein